MGIGISFGVTRSGEIFITGLSPKGPAKASGKVKEGDQLLAVDGVDVNGYQVKDIVQLILGKSGTQVRLDLLPAALEIPAAVGSLASLSITGRQQDSEQLETKQAELTPPEPQPKEKEVGSFCACCRYEDGTYRQRVMDVKPSWSCARLLSSCMLLTYPRSSFLTFDR